MSSNSQAERQFLVYETEDGRVKINHRVHTDAIQTRGHELIGRECR